MNVAAVALAAIVALASPATAETPSIEITSIEGDAEIKGRVAGLDPAEAERYRVIVYVHTDRWYIHPYASGGDGKSRAKIRPSGDWTLPTVRRSFAADEMAALLVEKEVARPSVVESIGAVDAVARTVRKLAGTPDEGKL